MDIACLENLSLDDRRPVGQQITEFIRSLIQCGSLEPGQRMPSQQELAALWSVKPSTVHHALQPLVQEGVLSRRPRVGTFVNQVTRSLKHVAIYLDADVWHESVGGATRAVVRNLSQELQQRGMTYQVYITQSPISCPESERRIDNQLIQDCKCGKVQAILAPLVSSTTTQQLLDLKVPFSLCGNGEYPGAVNPSRSQFVDKGLVELQRQGCQSVGLISTTSRQMSDDNHWRNLHANFQQRAMELGLQVNPKWVVMPREGAINEATAYHFGFSGFKSIWELDERPDGLLIYTDKAAHGVTDFVVQNQVLVPEQIKLVMHANSHQPLKAPFTFSSLTYDLARVAQLMIDSVNWQFDGQTVSPLTQGFDLIRVEPVKLRLIEDAGDVDLDYPLMSGA